MIVKYAVVYERTPNNYCAYAPELPGCISTGKTWDDIREMIREAITFHLEDMAENGEPVLPCHRCRSERLWHTISKVYLKQGKISPTQKRPSA